MMISPPAGNVPEVLFYPCSDAELPPDLAAALRTDSFEPTAEDDGADLDGRLRGGPAGSLLLRMEALTPDAWRHLNGVVRAARERGWTVLGLIPDAPPDRDALTERVLVLGAENVCPDMPPWTLLRHHLARHHHERRQRVELDRLRRAVDLAPYGLTITDALAPDNPIIYANEGFQRVTGYSLDEILGRNCRFLQRDLVNQAPVATLRQAIRAGEGCQVTLFNFRKDGQAFFNELTLTPLQDQDGRVTNFVGVQYDVTTRVEALAASQESQERFRALIGLLPTRIWITDADLRFEFLNDAWKDFFPLPPGFAPSDGRGWLGWVHPEDQAIATETLARARETRRPLGLEMRLVRPDGETRQFFIEAVPRLDGDGQWQGLLGSAADVTESRTAQDVTERRLRQLSLQSMLLRRMVAGPGNNPAEEGTTASGGVLALLGEMAGATAMHLLEFTGENARMTQVNRWEGAKGGTDPSPFDGRRLSEVLPFSAGALLVASEPVVARPSELRRLGGAVGALVTAPVRRNGTTVGAIVASGQDDAPAWAGGCVDLLQDIAPMLSSLLVTGQAESKSATG